MAGRGFWDLTGTYSLTVGGYPLVLIMVHDTKGKITGTTMYTAAAPPAVAMPIRASVKGTAGDIVVKMALQGANTTKTVSLTLALDLTVNAGTCKLTGTMAGSVRINGTTTPVSEVVALPIPAPMNGTWTLLFDLDQSGRAVTGTAELTLSNLVKHTFVVRGKTGANNTAVLSLAGDPGDPDASAIGIRTTLLPQEGAWARIESFSGRGYGQVVGW